MNSKTYDQTIQEKDISFIVIVSRHSGKWLFWKHKDRNTYESPGCRREENESIWQTAHREFYEESGAIDYDLIMISPYRIDEKCGMLFYAGVKKLTTLPDSEIESIHFFDDIPVQLTYPELEHELMDRIKINLSCEGHDQS
ncbi:NUDIX domain-containing protein [Thermoactinomyces daqus]|uniref:NUDIX domain-containing protein n=2 Tax=Thermoactinomyces daqus TaxID=1329516 RepID=A0A7W1XCY9_9BACL|nr:NUDIX domain-containing protein [Thermoactinomyces daqus]